MIIDQIREAPKETVHPLPHITPPGRDEETDGET
jgi:hypothetical protein